MARAGSSRIDPRAGTPVPLVFLGHQSAGREGRAVILLLFLSSPFSKLSYFAACDKWWAFFAALGIAHKSAFFVAERG